MISCQSNWSHFLKLWYIFYYTQNLKLSSLSMKCPVYGKSYLWDGLFINLFFYEMSYLWNVLFMKCPSMKCPFYEIWNIYGMSFFMKCPIYEMSYLWFCYIWNVLFIKCPFYDFVIYDMFFLWNVLSMILLYMKCPSMNWPNTD